MDTEKKKLPKRLNVSLNEEEIKFIEETQEKHNISKAKVIRKALKYLRIAEEKEISPLKAEYFLDFLASGEHIALDIEEWRAFFVDMEEYPEEFWNKIYEIGKEHQGEYYDKGLRSVEDILEYVEKSNLYVLSKDSEKGFTLIPRVIESNKYIKKFLEGFFDASNKNVEVKQAGVKIRVRNKS